MIPSKHRRPLSGLLWSAAALCLSCAPSAHAAVTFAFDYSDPSAEEYWTPEARAALTAAGQKVASYLTGYTATVTIAVTAYDDPGDVTLAYGGANFDLAGGNPGFGNPGAVANKILSNGIFDENGSEPDGYIGRNLGRLDVGYGDPVSGTEVDFATVLRHELGHTLGIFGNISEQGAPYFDGYFVPYSEFLVNSAGQKMVNFNSISGLWEVDVPLWLQASTGGPGSGMYFDGPGAVEANGGNLVALYSPEIYSDGSSLIHLDEDTFGRSIMTPFAGHGPGRHDFSNIEIGIFRDLGYTLFGAASSVPDTGATLALLGSSLCGMGLIRRRLRR